MALIAGIPDDGVGKHSGICHPNRYGGTESWVTATASRRSFRVAGAAATTDHDRNSLQLLTNEFEVVKQWSSKLVEGRVAERAASEKIIACGRFLVRC